MLTQRLQAAVPPAVRQICSRLQQRGHAAWVVGGCVRDHLLFELSNDGGHPPRGDWDITTSATPRQVQGQFSRVIPTGIEHGTVTVVVDKVGYEVTTFRTESGYVDGRRPSTVSFVGDLIADLARRDFTVNAIAYDPLNDELADPFDGVLDLEHRLIRAVGNPEERFREDGLRTLRAARFVATLEFQLDAPTERAIRPSLDSYRKISSERIRDEWQKALAARRPSLAFDIMMRHGLLDITAPELTEQTTCHASEAPQASLWTYTLRSVDECPPRVPLRMAALLHAVGRPRWERGEHPADGRPEALSAAMAQAMVKRLKFSNAEMTRITSLVRHQHIEGAHAWSDAQLRRWLRRVTPALVEDLCELNRARARALRGAPGTPLSRCADVLQARAQRLLAVGVALSVKDLAINGHDLVEQLGLSPGRQLGELLTQLLEDVTETPEWNTREQLLERARDLLHQRRG